MLELIAQGKMAGERWRKMVLANIPFVIGRTSKDWSVAWDGKISRRHASLRLEGSVLHVEKIADAANPIFFQGAESDQFAVNPGEHFAIGDTTFLLSNDSALATLELPSPVSQRGFSAEFLKAVHYRDADHRISVLNRLPEIISSSNNEAELHVQMVSLLLAGIKSATGVGICRRDDGDGVEVVAWDKRDLSGKNLSGGDFSPSTNLIEQALGTGESTLHMWRTESPSGLDVTTDMASDWAFVCPLAGPSSKDWVIYVSGVSRQLGDSQETEEDVQGDVKFAELVGATLANLRRVQKLEQRQSTFRAFFSPVVIEAFVDQDPEEVLKPRQCDISVLFCDLRGFSAKSEQMSDQLEELLDRVSQALGVMTKIVLDFGGVIGDFHGDSAMGFWGWPLDRDDFVENACSAALHLQTELESIAAADQHRLQDFQMGIGMATGRAVAGKIGTSHQVKVTAFGPVVNLAARLEGMTRFLGLPMIVDKSTVDMARGSVRGIDSLAGFRFLGKFKPYGLNTANKIYQMYPADSPPSAELLEQHSQAMELFSDGNWRDAAKILENIASMDAAARYVSDFIKNNDLDNDFDGVISPESK